MIDKEAKIFGKINIIDLVLVVGLVGLIAFGAYQFYSGRGIIGGETREFIATFFTEEIEDWAVDSIRVGDYVFDHIRGNFVGVVTDFSIGEAIVWNADQHGNTVRATKEGFSSVEVSVRLTGTPSQHTVMVAGHRFGVGMNYTLRVGGNAIITRVSGLREVG